MDSSAPDETPVNPPPEDLERRVYVLRETVALLFVGFWLCLFAGELLTQKYTIPFWFHCVSVGVLGYALGVSVGQLTSYRKPTVRSVVEARRGAP